MRTRFPSSAVVAILAVLAAGCGDSSDDDDGSTGVPSAGSNGGEAGGNAGTGAAGASGNGAGGSSGHAGGASGGTAGAGAGGGTAGAGAAGQGSGDAGSAGDAGGGADDGGVMDDTPLLERAIDPEYTCSVKRAPATLGVTWYGGILLPNAAGDGFLVRADGDFGRQVSASTLSVNGVLGERRLLFTTDTYAYWVAAAAGPDRFTAVWLEDNNSDPRLNYAQINAAGTVLRPAAELSPSGEHQNPAKIVATANGYAVAWVEAVAGRPFLRMAFLDAQGAVQGTPVTVRDDTSVALNDLVATADGFGIAYQVPAPPVKDYYQVLDAQGQPASEPVEIGTGADTALLRRGDEVLVASSVTGGSYENSDIYSVLRVSRFDASGARVGPSYDLQSPVEDQTNVHPFWIAIDDDVGLLWSQGSVIYICAGCVPDNHADLVILDGDDFTPRSEVLELVNASTSGGFLNPQLVHSGDDLLFTTSVTYHVSAEAASATIHCAR
jgi:hypothetical protein